MAKKYVFTVTVFRRCNTLSWDPVQGMLFIGGRFNLIDDKFIPPGLAVWTEEIGLQPFPGGGLTHDDYGVGGVALCITFDPRSQVRWRKLWSD